MNCDAMRYINVIVRDVMQGYVIMYNVVYLDLYI